MSICNPSDSKSLKTDQIVNWFETEWMNTHPELAVQTLWSSSYCTNDEILAKIDPAQSFEGYRFELYREIDCPVVSRIDRFTHQNVLTDRLGAFVMRFIADKDTLPVEVIMVTAHYDEEGYYTTSLAAVPQAFTAAWTAFTNECNRLAYNHEGRVVVVGGRQDSFVPTADWDEIILPASLKKDIMDDVLSFFTKGVDVYNRLNLKPFRKLLLAGVPGTGKTMLCNALAKWALDQDYLVIYVSSARKGQNDQYGSNFGKIQHALEVAAYSERPSLILLEELDAYLHDDEKALILNVLDGSESTINSRGTLMISTTNYPESIDERVLKRPGRLDRIFIVPEARTEVDAGAMLKRYLGSMWQEAHQAVVPQLVGYPGAFIREVAVYALTQVAYDDLTELSLEMLEQSYKGLKAQIDARDDFLKRKNGTGFAAEKVNGNYN